MKSVLQDWVTELGWRHQGSLLTAVRGCDTAPKYDPSKLLSRCYRAVILNPHCGDASKAQTFIEAVDSEELCRRFKEFRTNLDHYPHHYVMHFIHACQIVGFKHPDAGTRALWISFYVSLCGGMHMNPETPAQLDERLNADEDSFGARNRS